MAQLRTCDLRGNSFPCPFQLRFCAVDCLSNAAASDAAAAAAAAAAANAHSGEHAPHEPPQMPLADALGPLGEQRSGPLDDSVLEEALQAVVADEAVEQVAVNAAADADRAELARQAIERARLERRVRERYSALSAWGSMRAPDLYTILLSAVSIVICVLLYLLLQARRRNGSATLSSAVKAKQ
jgi:hypothetical protein